MAVTALETPAGDIGTWDDGLLHYYCCDENVAMCGLDLKNVPVVDDESDTPECPLCALAREEDAPCPVKGCTGRRDGC